MAFHAQAGTNNIPEPPVGRITALDRARGIAILGMIVENYVTVIYGWSRDGIDLAGGIRDALPHLFSRMLEGRSAPLFVIIAGMGLSFMTSRGRENADAPILSRKRRTVMKRALFLFCVGMAFMLIWPPDILHYFGCYFAIGALLITASNKKLLGGALFFVLGFVVLFLVLDYYRDWDWETLTYPGLWTGVSSLIKNLLFNGFHPIFPWTAFFLFGMWLGRRKLDSAGLSRGLVVIGLVLLIVLETASGISSLCASPASRVGEFLSTEFFPPLPGYILSTGASASLIIGLMLLLEDSGGRSKRPGPLAATGQLSLTVYLAHVIVGMGVLETIGRLEHQTIGFALLSAGICCVVSVAFAFVWRRTFDRGPFEALMRWITG
jgi:uncharacterized membrane protein YeiB